MARTCERRVVKKGQAISEDTSHPSTRHRRCCHQGGGSGYPLLKQMEPAALLSQLALHWTRNTCRTALWITPCTLLLSGLSLYAQLHFTVLFIMCSGVSVFCPGVCVCVGGGVCGGVEGTSVVYPVLSNCLSYCRLYKCFIGTVWRRTIFGKDK